MMRRVIPIAVAAALLLGAALAATPASASYGLKDLDVTFTGPDGAPSMQAGSHPFAMTTTVRFATTPDSELGFEVPDEATKLLRAFTVLGLAANPTATPRCSTLDFLDEQKCSPASQVGVNNVAYGDPHTTTRVPVYSLVPPPGVVAKLGFAVLQVPVTIEIGVEQSPPYHGVASLVNVPEALPIYGAELTLWGVPADPAHKAQRSGCAGGCAVDLAPKPFLTVPRACPGPLVTSFESVSWQHPETKVFGEAITHDGSTPPNPLGMVGCDRVGFGPHISAQATTDRVESPSGLELNLDVTDEGLNNPTGIAQSDVKKAVITFPAGVTANPSLAEGLAVCSPADLERETVNAEAGEGCPEASKIGSLELETPLLEGKLLKGSVFIAQPDDPTTATPGAENPFDSLLALYMVLKDPGLGIIFKLPGKIEPDPRTGQLVSTFDELPQYPFSHFRVRLREGGRSPLITPPTCGTYTTKAVLTPWANPSRPLTTGANFEIDRGLSGGRCPVGNPPFHPGFEAGAINNDAGSYSPDYLRLTRQDGDQDLTKFSATLPPGALAKLAGVSKCPEAQIAAARAKTGRAEMASPSCPAASQIGRAIAGAGVGSQLTYVPGKIYLGGPYNGDPLSIVAVVPAVAGPFDVGTVVTRQALTVDPDTSEAQVDGSSSDPIPHILAGIPLKVRDIRAYIDRPNFTLNPTNCNEESFRAQIWGGGTDVFSSADDSPVSTKTRFQAANCANLRFKPALSLSLKGGTKRADHPALKAVVNYPRGGRYANIAKAIVTFPHSMFLDQAHIRTVCTRVQFAAEKCPAGSIYGHVRATTPLLDEVVEGPVYLRSSSHPLPDVVFALHGLVDINVVTRIDSSKARLRASLDSVPDVPVSKFVLEMQGGKKGLLINSRNLCAHKSRAIVNLTGQNGKVLDTNPVMATSCAKK